MNEQDALVIKTFLLGFFSAAAVYGTYFYIYHKISSHRELKNKYHKTFGYPPPKYLSKSDIKEALKIYEISHR